MAIEFFCPSCQTRIRAPEEAAGKKARCPKCQTIAPVPMASTPGTSPLSPLPDFNAGSGPNLSSPPPATDPFGQSQPNPFNPPASAFGGAPASASNPFSDNASAGQGSVGGGQMNPYGSPAYAAPSFAPLSREEARSKLLGPAIGITISAIICLAYAIFSIAIAAMNPNQPVPQDEAERIGYYIGFYGVMVVMVVPSLGMLAGALAMFTGKGLGLAWTGAVSAVLPCNPCCLIGLGFGIWGIVLLSDQRVANALK